MSQSGRDIQDIGYHYALGQFALYVTTCILALKVYSRLPMMIGHDGTQISWSDGTAVLVHNQCMTCHLVKFLSMHWLDAINITIELHRKSYWILV